MTDYLAELDDALDDLPRYFAVVDQARGGWLLGNGDGPEMVVCVTVADVRETLRRHLPCAPGSVATAKPINFTTRRNQELRAAVFKRDSFTCQHCGWAPSQIPDNYQGRYTILEAGNCLQVDHVVPRRLGGLSTLGNLQTLCQSCNSRKMASLRGSGSR